MKLSSLKKPEPPKTEKAFVPPVFEVTSKKEAEKVEAEKTGSPGLKPKKPSKKDAVKQEIAGVPVKDLTKPAEVAQENAEIKMQRVEWFDDRYYYCQFPDGEGEHYPSSTHVLGVIHSKYLTDWQVKVGAEEASRVLSEAGDRGTRIHHACENLLKGGVVLFNPFNKPQYTSEEVAKIMEKYGEKGVSIISKQHEYWQIMKFREWAKVVEPGVLGMEKMLCSRSNRYAGTLDYLFQIKGGTYNINGKTPVVLEDGIYIGDLKSSNNLHETYNLQVASYMMAYEEMYPEYAGKIKGCMIIHTNAKTKTGIEGLATIVRTREQVLEDFEHFKAVLKVWNWNNPSEKPIIRDFPSIISLTTI